jgi:hypothetical protein
MDENIKLRMIRNRAKALYHDCLSSACFAYSDADKIDDEDIEAVALRRQGQAYEVVAGWIKGLIDII